ncbi:zinc ribbon domain-containing protein [Methanococcus maripaludis]|uniref:Ribosomal protein S27AE n=1 Tax=Methanococcus maripaludis TaxID=39152 RepID=A0A7J9PEK7_METMI|nr:zinc ribbon domain-containing protein [Methanococcus maripaludis]MBA2861100.1 ribosomal protein S27AE [Methanococcus maripaludis]
MKAGFLKTRPKRKLDMVPKKYGKCENHRIMIDRCNFTLYNEFLLSNAVKKDRKFNLEVYQKWSKYAESMIDDKGRVQGLKFVLKEFEGEPISWIKISMREPYIAKAYVNIIKWYRMENKIPRPAYGFKDTNFIPIRYNKTEQILEEVSEIYCRVLRGLKERYEEILENLGLTPKYLGKTIIKPDSIELPVEFLKRDIVEYEYLFDKAKGISLSKYNDFTRTTYINPTKKSINCQLKLYQKAPGIARMEVTLNKDFAHSLDDKSESGIIKLEIKRLIDRALELYGLSLEGVQPLKLSNEALLLEYSNALKVPMDILKVLIFSKSLTMSFDRDNVNLRRLLTSKRLIEKVSKGKYVRTELTESLRLIFGQYELCPNCKTIMQNGTEFKIQCPKCGFEKIDGVKIGD